MPRKNERESIIADIVLDSAVGHRVSRISDLSMGGCFIESVTNFRAGESIAFDLTKGDGTTLSFTGEVAYVLDNFGFGLAFTNLGPQQLEFLRCELPAATKPVADPQENLVEIW